MSSSAVLIDGAELRRRRIEKRLMQYELATLVEVDQGHLSKIESGRRPRISVTLLRRLEAHLGPFEAPVAPAVSR